MSRKRVYEDPAMMTPGMGPTMLPNGGSYYDDTAMYCEPSNSKRQAPAYPSNYPYNDSWDTNRPDPYAAPNSAGMDYERYDIPVASNPQHREPSTNNAPPHQTRKLTLELPMPSLPRYDSSSNFGLGLDKYGFEQPGPLMTEFQDIVAGLKEELAFLKRHPEVSNRIPFAMKVLEREAYKLENSIEPEWLEVDINKPINLSRKVIIPYGRHPAFNFVGKIIGAKGQTLQNLAKVFKSQIMLMGETSCRDSKKEAQLYNSGNPKYMHYGLPLFIQISTIARPHIAFQRMANLLNCLHKLLLPSHDIHVSGITDGNIWFDSGETIVYNPTIFDEQADETKEYELRSKISKNSSVASRGRGARTWQKSRGEGNSTIPGADEDGYVFCYDPNMIESESSSSSIPRNVKPKPNTVGSNGNGDEFRMSPVDQSTRGRGRGRGRGAVPIRRL